VVPVFRLRQPDLDVNLRLDGNLHPAEATGTGGPGGRPGKGGGGVNAFGAINVAVIDITSGSARFERSLHLSALAVQ